MSIIFNNLQNIKRNIADACEKVDRNPNEIKIVAVSKTVDIEKIKEVINYDIDTFGENKVQELTRKYDEINSTNNSIKWHMIGHLQTNKVKYIIDKVELIHSLDRIKLAEEINKRALKVNRVIDVLVQVNIGQENSKYGLHPNDVDDFINKIENYKNIRVKGLMAMAPYSSDPEEVRPFFSKMKNIFDKIKEKNIYNVEMKYLSMGMTNDYKIAIEEGANIVRIGTGIFGSRNYKL